MLPNDDLIITRGLSKHYGAVQALADLSITVRRGEVYGLLGPNGSGKTTAIRLLLGFLKPSAGSATIMGFDCTRDSVNVRRYVTFIPGELRLPGYMTGFGLLRFLSDLRGGMGFDRAVSLADQVMKLDLGRKVRTYSTGMKQKLALAQAFADPVDILILDEPTSALDPTARSTILELVEESRRVGQTVVFSGHVLSEVEQVADRVAIMRRGRLMHIEDMHARRSLRMLLVRFEGEVPEEYPDHLELTPRERNGSNAILFEHRGAPGPLLSWLSSQNVADLAVGTEDLRALYDQYHGPNAVDEK